MRALPDNFIDSRDFARIARAIRFIDARFREQPRLRDMAAHVGLSEFHFNRLFHRWAGVTPKQYLAFVTAGAARRALRTASSVLETSLAVGLSGPGRLHDLLVTLEAVSPGELKSGGAGLTIRFGCSDTPFGRALIAQTSRGLCHLAFIDEAGEAAAHGELQARWQGAHLEHDDAGAQAVARRIWTGVSADAAPLKVAVPGTNFQLKVWRALVALGARELTNYGEIARAIGAPRALRAVGNAVGANPVAWLIPCHHVLRTGGALGGYRWGEERKRAMLAWEALPGETPDGPRAVASRA